MSERKLFTKAEINPRCRAEELTSEEFIRLTRIFAGCRARVTQGEKRSENNL